MLSADDWNGIMWLLTESSVYSCVSVESYVAAIVTVLADEGPVRRRSSYVVSPRPSLNDYKSGSDGLWLFLLFLCRRICWHLFKKLSHPIWFRLRHRRIIAGMHSFIHSVIWTRGPVGRWGLFLLCEIALLCYYSPGVSTELPMSLMNLILVSD